MTGVTLHTLNNSYEKERRKSVSATFAVNMLYVKKIL